MRVLAIGNLYPPAGGGGYERIFASTMAALRAAGHEATVLTTAPVPGAELPPNTLDEPYVHRELRWWWRNHGFQRAGLLERRRVERHNAAVIDRHLAQRPDVVSYWGLGGLPLSLIDRIRRAGVPAVGLVGDDWMLYGPKVDRAPGRAVAFDGIRWLVISQFLAARIPPLHGAEVVSPGVDSTRFAERPPQPWHWRLACVGRVDPRKGIAVAIEALRRLPEEATLVVDGSGDPAHLGELQRLADERVTFQCSPAARVADVYAAADAVLFPVTWQEPWGLVPLEAMAVGRPVVATGTGGSDEYLEHERNALLVPRADPAALAAAVRRLAQEDALRERLRAGGFDTARRYDQRAFEERVIGALQAESAATAN